MDPLSITTGCLALAQAVAKSAIAVNRFIRSCRDARSDLMTLHAKLNELKLVLELLQYDASTATTIPDGLQQQVVSMITRYGAVVADIDAVIDLHTQRRRTDGMRWAWDGKDKVAVLRQSLETHRGALMLAVETMQLCLAKEIKADTTAIRNDTSEIPDVKRNTEEILEEILRLRLEISDKTKAEGNFMLERYLDNLTTYAETVVNGDLEDPSNTYEVLQNVEEVGNNLRIIDLSTGKLMNKIKPKTNLLQQIEIESLRLFRYSDNSLEAGNDLVVIDYKMAGNTSVFEVWELLPGRRRQARLMKSWSVQQAITSWDIAARDGSPALYGICYNSKYGPKGQLRSFDVATGQLIEALSPCSIGNEKGETTVQISRTGKFVIVTDWDDSKVQVFKSARDTSDPSWEPVRTLIFMFGMQRDN
ncbi:Fc.00g083150.m01.CDS01 [Cosmosporella sp. VM-42]